MEKFALEMNQSETRIACGGHGAMWAFGITWRPSFVVCHLLTFQILIFFETHQPNELKLSKKYLW
jgi:hypothetical protein